jgi:hypothetical protein
MDVPRSMESSKALYVAIRIFNDGLSSQSVIPNRTSYGLIRKSVAGRQVYI